MGKVQILSLYRIREGLPTAASLERMLRSTQPFLALGVDMTARSLPICSFPSTTPRRYALNFSNEIPGARLHTVTVNPVSGREGYVNTKTD